MQMYLCLNTLNTTTYLAYHIYSPPTQGTKIYGKSSLRWIPIIGWIWMFTENIFLKRAWDSDKVSLVNDLSYLCDYPKDCPVTVSPASSPYTPPPPFIMCSHPFRFLTLLEIHAENESFTENIIYIYIYIIISYLEILNYITPPIINKKFIPLLILFFCTEK